MAGSNTIIQGVNYKLVDAVVNTDYDIIPFDFGGKPLTEMTIEVDTTVDSVYLYLPEIISSAVPPAYSFGGVYGTTIKIIALTGLLHSVLIQTQGSDTIGGGPNISLSNNGSSAVFTILNSTTWSVVVTEAPQV